MISICLLAFLSITFTNCSIQSLDMYQIDYEMSTSPYFTTYAYSNIKESSLNSTTLDRCLIFLHGAGENASYYKDMYISGEITIPDNSLLLIL